MQNARLDESQTGIKIDGRPQISTWYHFNGRNEEELKSLLMRWKRRVKRKNWFMQHSGNEDNGIWSCHFVANRWGKCGRVSDFISLGCKINVDGDCSHEIERCLFFGRIAMMNLDSVLKSIDITLPPKVHIVKAMVFPVVMYICESWAIKKTELWRIDAFELWCWRRFLRIPWTARRANQSILKRIIPEYSLEGLMLKPKLQYLGHLMQRVDLLENSGKDWGQEEKGLREDEMVGLHHWLNGYEFEQTQGDSEGQGSLMCCSSWDQKESNMTQWLNNNIHLDSCFHNHWGKESATVPHTGN